MSGDTSHSQSPHSKQRGSRLAGDRMNRDMLELLSVVSMGMIRSLPEKNFEMILEVIEDLVEANQEVPVIVEGHKDEKTLRQIGCAGKILVFNSGESVTNFCESLAEKGIREVIILTDWDRHGAFLLRRLTEELNLVGIRCNLEIRRRLAFYSRKYVKDVESLAGFLEDLEPPLP